MLPQKDTLLTRKRIHFGTAKRYTTKPQKDTPTRKKIHLFLGVFIVVFCDNWVY